jgi:ribonuclease P protein component
VGVVVAKFGRGSVERNRLKRRLRELVRREVLPAWRDAEPVDVLVRALPQAYERSHADLRTELALLAQRIDRQRSTTEAR